MVDQVAKQFVGKAFFVGPGGVAKDAIESALVGLLDFTHGILQRLADVGGQCANIAPVAAFWDLKAVVLREEGIFLVSARFRQGCCYLLIIDIRDTFEKE